VREEIREWGRVVKGKRRCMMSEEEKEEKRSAQFSKLNHFQRHCKKV
jgi:hypothetical protein